MAGNNEIDQTVRGDQGSNDMNAILSCIDNTRNSMTAKDYNNCLQTLGKDSGSSLPSLELFDAKADVPPPPEIKLPGTSDKDLAADGIKRQHGMGADGKETTTTEFPNGVKISAGGGSESINERGAKIVVEPSSIITSTKEYPEHPKGSGVHVDSHNKPVYSENKDGSTTVYTEGGVYTARTDGTVTKESAIKGKDGTWTVLDTSSPLGGMKPSDMANVNQPEKRHSH